ncbi:MAG: hypothetical protein FWG94_08060 [Oscillospiraceae bacterium]|nr:hypothetical protein [Oscillospiraceae bacterium]
MGSKSINKSFHCTQEIYDYVMSQPGEGFNQKFENMVLYCQKEETGLRARAAEIKNDIGIWAETLGALKSKAIETQKVIYFLEAIQGSCDNFNKFIDSINGVLNKAGDT